MNGESYRAVGVQDAQFWLEDPLGEPFRVEASGDWPTGLLEMDGCLVVYCATESGDVAVAAAVRESEPVAGADWDEVCEISLACETGLQIRETFGGAITPIVDAGGQYRLRVSSRHLLADAGDGSEDDPDEDDPDEDDPNIEARERFLLEFWPAGLAAARVLRSVEVAEVVRPVRQYVDAARAGARRIAADLLGKTAADLSGELVEITAERSYYGKIKIIYDLFRDLSMSASGGGSRTGPPAVGESFVYSGSDIEDDFFDGTPTGSKCDVECTWRELKPPRRIVVDLNFAVPATRPGAGSWEKVPFLSTPSRLQIDIDAVDPAMTIRNCTVRFTHSQLPVEWAEDMRTAWLCRLEASELLLGIGEPPGAGH